jgi:serine/threonine protein kinase
VEETNSDSSGGNSNNDKNTMSETLLYGSEQPNNNLLTYEEANIFGTLIDSPGNKEGAKNNREKQDLENNTLAMTEFDGLYIPAFLAGALNTDYLYTSEICKTGMAVIFLGKLLNPELIARNQEKRDCVIKRLRPEYSATDNMILQEVSILWMVRNEKNISQIISYSINPALIVLKLYSLGGLHDFLHDKTQTKNINYSLDVVIQLLQDITAALCYIHGKKIVHCDLKPQNILLEMDDGALHAYLSDFGMSKIVQETNVISSLKIVNKNGLTIRYAAPECLMQVNLGTKFEKISKTDIYSLGIMMWEMFTRKIPFKKYEDYEIMEKVVKGSRPKLSRLPSCDYSGNLAILLEKCWHQESSERPDMEYISYYIKTCLKTEK